MEHIHVDAHVDTHADAGATVIEQRGPAQNVSPRDPSVGLELGRELMAPGHLYNRRTGTGIEWYPAGAGAERGAPGRVRLWSRGWSGEPTVIAEAEHHASSPWEYWYNLEFAISFPQVTHWWFGDAWTGMVRIWRPEGAGRDPESGTPMLSGWLRFGPFGPLGPLGPPGPFGQTGPLDTEEPADPDLTPLLPWTVLLSNPLRVNAPLPPMAANVSNLPLQLLLAETLVEMLEVLDAPTEGGSRADGGAGEAPYIEAALTSLVRREDLSRAFPTRFGPWRLDRLPDLTPREALCRVQGLEPG